jgi:hypothetical protein
MCNPSGKNEYNNQLRRQGTARKKRNTAVAKRQTAARARVHNRSAQTAARQSARQAERFK